MSEDNKDDIELLSQEQITDDGVSHDLADILGADEEKMNLTSVVDAVLDDERDLENDVSESETQNPVLEENTLEDISDEPLNEALETDIPSFFKENKEETSETVVAENVSDNQLSDAETFVEDDITESKVEPILDQSKPNEEHLAHQNKNLSDKKLTMASEEVLWQLLPREKLSDNPFVLNENSGFMHCEGNKHQSDLQIVITKPEDASLWRLFVLCNFEVPLHAGVSDFKIDIDKKEDVIRYISLMEKGAEKIRMFNQSSFRFLSSQDGFFSAQGNVICGQLNDDNSLLVQDYCSISLSDKLNQVLAFSKPVSGFICGPNNVCVFFANIADIMLSVQDFVPQSDIIEYLPPLKNLDTKEYFVFDPASDDKEFIAQGKQKYLMLNVDASLYGWNIRFDNEMYMSLRDALEYQRKYKKLPSANGEILFGSKQFRFFNVEKLQIRTKVTYYAYGRL